MTGIVCYLSAGHECCNRTALHRHSRLNRGTVTNGLGYAAAIIPGTEWAAPGLFAAGKGLSAAGTIITASGQYSQGKTDDGTVTLITGAATLGTGQLIDNLKETSQITKGTALAFNFGNELVGHATDALHDYAMKKTEAPKPNVPKVAPKFKSDPKKDKFVQDLFKAKAAAEKAATQKGKKDKKKP